MKFKFYIITLCLIVVLPSCSNDDDNGGNSLDNIVLVTPSDGESPVSRTPDFTWAPYTAGEQITYALALGTSVDAMAEIAIDLTASTYSIALADILELETEYFWKVTAYQEGSIVAESSTQSFFTETISPILISENAAYGSRKGAAVAVFNNKIWVTGGRDESDNALSDIWSSTDGENWINEGNLPSTYYGHTLIEFNGRLWLYGGINSTGFQSRVIYSSMDGVNWNEETEIAPFVQYQSAKFVVHRDRIYRIAGYDGDVDELSPERNLYSSLDGLNWTLETENHGFDTKYGFEIESLSDTLYCLEPNPDNSIQEIYVRTSTDAVDWSLENTVLLNERGFTTLKSVVYNNSIIMMIPPEGGGFTTSTFYQSFDGQDWQLVQQSTPMPIRAIFYELVHLNGTLFAIGGAQRSSFSETNNTVWKLN